MYKLNLLILISLLSLNICFAQDLEGLNAKNGLHNKVADLRVKTIKLYKTGNPLADPIIKLNSSETITLNFDDVYMSDEGYRDFYYTITHCNSDWEKSNLILNDFVTGFTENDIVEVNQHMGTSTSFSNYELVLPNNNTKLKISGNYIMSVFDKSERELVFEKEFRVFEPLMGVMPVMKPAISNNRAQQLEFTVNHNKLTVRNPSVNLNVKVYQNNIPFVENKLQPSFSVNNRTDYTQPDKSTYLGINEFRAFDIRILSYRGRGVHDIKVSNSDRYNVLLVTDEDRTYKDYTFVKDANGKYVISSDNAYNENTQSDYVNVLFTLEIPESKNSKIYVFGELTNWILDKEFELSYNSEEGVYETLALLKQGYYNYRYVVVKDGKIDYALLENSFYETENDYNIFVYYKDIGDRYERLVAFEKINSRNTSIMR